MILAPHQQLPCLEDTALLLARYQPHINGCRVWKTLLFYSHDTSLTSAAAVCRGLRSLTHSRCFIQAPASVAHPLASSEAAPTSERQRVILWNGAQKRGVTWCPCAEKRAKARSHLVPLRGKAREGEESPDAPARKSARRRGVTWCPCTEKRAKARSHLVPLHGKARESEESPDAPAQKSARRRLVTWCPCAEKRAKARSHLVPLRGKACEGEESPGAPARKSARRRGVTWCPCAEKRAKAISHLMPLRRKARECEESPDAPARTLSAFKISLGYYISCSRPYEVVFN